MSDSTISTYSFCVFTDIYIFCSGKYFPFLVGIIYFPYLVGVKCEWNKCESHVEYPRVLKGQASIFSWACSSNQLESNKIIWLSEHLLQIHRIFFWGGISFKLLIWKE